MQIVAYSIGELLKEKTLLFAEVFSREQFKHAEDVFQKLKRQEFPHCPVAVNRDDIGVLSKVRSFLDDDLWIPISRIFLKAAGARTD